ncbi:MAG TPA: replication-associated recombination protein A, partial [bacterium]|nr:replication-associated recombination protein A [bacterium]
KREKITGEKAEAFLKSRPLVFDKKGDEHYDTVSALIKSVRGSDPDAALYWLGKLVASGEDPRFICRRLLILSSEDVGLADPYALILAEAAAGAVERVGLPEARINLAHLVIYLSCAPKSNTGYLAVEKAMEYINKENLEVPRHLTKRGQSEYKYPHDFPGGWVEQKYLPKEISFLSWKGIGDEKRLQEELEKRKAKNKD